jgi:hypothetical protein
MTNVQYWAATVILIVILGLKAIGILVYAGAWNGRTSWMVPAVLAAVIMLIGVRIRADLTSQAAQADVPRRRRTPLQYAVRAMLKAAGLTLLVAAVSAIQGDTLLDFWRAYAIALPVVLTVDLAEWTIRRVLERLRSARSHC